MASPAVLANNTIVNINVIDVSGDLNSVTLNITTGTIDASVFGITGWKEFITSISEWGLSIAGFFDKASAKIDATMFALFGAPLTPTAVFVDIPNSNTGSIKYSGNAWGTSYKSDGKVNDAWRMSGDLKGTSTLTRAVL